jgi:rod shape-determining protein MreB and related proteins
MSRFFKLLDQAPSLVGVKSVRVGLDFGSANTRIRVGNALKFSEPSCAIFHQNTKSMVATGTKAEGLRSSQHQKIEYFRPVQHGVMTDISLAGDYLSSILGKILGNNKDYLLARIEGYCLVPSSITPVEKIIFERSLAAAGMGRWRLIAKSKVWQRLLSGKGSHRGFGGSIDIGGDTTEVCLVTAGGGTEAVTIPFGGRTVISRLQVLVRKKFNCDVSGSSAQKILAGFSFGGGSAAKAKSRKVAVRGKDVVSGRPITLTVESSEFFSQVELVFDELVEYLELFFGQLPAELITQSLDNGLVLSGGVSQLKGLNNFLGEKLQVTISKSKTPTRDLIVGLW